MQKKPFRFVLIAALVALVVAVPAAMGGAASESTVSGAEGTGLWFVEIDGSPASFRAEARAVGVKFEERYAYSTLWNGLSIAVSKKDAPVLSRLNAVKAVFPVVPVSLPTTQSAPDLATALGMTGADVAQNELGLTGEGIKVAVMDTGIDYNHPDLGGGWGNRVVAGYDFVGDSFNANPTVPEYQPVPQPDDDPMDCNGHGTHVAGIVGADGASGAGGATGVAPGVQFGAYRVFGCEGSTTADIMLAAMERALADGMDVLNMSIGSAFQWPQYPTAVAASNLVDRGMVVVASIGNSGADGVYSAGAPGLGEKVIGVASFDNTHISALSFIVNPSGEQVAYLPLATTTPPPTSGDSDPVVYVGRGCPIDPGYTTVADDYLADPNGKVALIDRGACTFNGKYQRAVDAGATAVVIANNLPGLFAGGGVEDRGVPGVAISLADGNHIKELLESETVTLTWTDDRINAPNPTGGLISSFSSYGLSPDLSLKPDIGAPGGLIRSAYPLALGGYAIVSGTSMASPHVAGGAALLLEARPGIATEDVRTLMQNSADPKPWWGAPGLGFLDNVHRQGAGMLDIPGAALAETWVTPSKLALGESEAGPATRTLTIRNTSSTAVTYELSHEGALGTHGSTFAPAFNAAFASVEFGSDSVTVPAGGSATVEIVITAPAAPDKGQYGGYIVLTGEGEASQTYRIPYAGFIGDYQSITVLTPTVDELPALAKLTACDRLIGFECTMGASWSLQRDGATFTMQGLDYPNFLVHFDHQAQVFKAEVLTAAGRPVHPVFSTAWEVHYLPRNSTPDSFFVYVWDGTRKHSHGKGGSAADKRKVVPNGTYRIRLSVLKALGDPRNAEHWESWTSPPITIARPGANPAGRGKG